MRINCRNFSGPAIIAFAIWTAVVGVQPLSVHAHGALHERIVGVTGEIAARPQDASLYLQRAELYRQHLQFSEALADLGTAARLAPEINVVHLAQARVFAESGQTTNALAEVESFLKVEPEHAGALIIRARCRLALGQAQAAIADFTHAVVVSKALEPDLLLERARAQAAAGQLANAVRGLDEGMARVGAVPSLQLAAIEYDRQRAAFDDALSRVDKIMAGQPVKEPWLALRGEILAQSGRLDEARAAFQQTLDGIANYPPPRRDLELTRQLERRVRENLVRIQARQLSSQ